MPIGPTDRPTERPPPPPPPTDRTTARPPTRPTGSPSARPPDRPAAQPMDRPTDRPIARPTADAASAHTGGPDGSRAGGGLRPPVRQALQPLQDVVRLGRLRGQPAHALLNAVRAFCEGPTKPDSTRTISGADTGMGKC